jgi:hypothetical protein
MSLLIRICKGLSILLPYSCESPYHPPERWAALQRCAHDYCRGSKLFAFAFDSRRDERDRGTTVYPDNFAHVLEAHVTLLDAPGRPQYGRNQAAVVALADAALLCVSADSDLERSLRTGCSDNRGGIDEGDDDGGGVGFSIVRIEM